MGYLTKYLENNNLTYKELGKLTNIPETTLHNLNKRPVKKWTIEQIDSVAKAIGKKRGKVIKEIEDISLLSEDKNLFGKYNLENRRYIGNKNKLIRWIKGLVEENIKGNSFFDVFAGTGVVTKGMISDFDEFYINDFLYSNNIIYKAFFGKEAFDLKKLLNLQHEYNRIKTNEVDDEYFVQSYGDKFFSNHDARIIGEIRQLIELNGDINNREKSILISSLLYSSDKIANTVGHYDAYRKKNIIPDRFEFKLIQPINTENKKIHIFREDANVLVKHISADVAFVDPPYNSRQYSRFYHVLEEITKWDKPNLSGVAMKPPLENMSEYSKNDAPEVFDNLVTNLKVKYIIVTYNNTYNSKSSSSRNKITFQQILTSLNKVGETNVYDTPYKYFNAGKTDLKNHKEYVFITKVNAHE